MSAVVAQPRRRAGRPPCCPPETARRVQELKDQGYSLREMAQRLNDEGVPTPTGRAKQWSRSHVDGVLGRRYMRELAMPVAPQEKLHGKSGTLRQSTKAGKSAPRDLPALSRSRSSRWLIARRGGFACTLAQPQDVEELREQSTRSCPQRPVSTSAEFHATTPGHFSRRRPRTDHPGGRSRSECSRGSSAVQN
jgi:hypothetical protein